MVLDLFLDLVDITSVRDFALNLDLVLLFETTGLFFTFVSVVSSAFNKLLFVLTVGVIRNVSEPNITYYNLSKTDPVTVILSMVL